MFAVRPKIHTKLKYTATRHVAMIATPIIGGPGSDNASRLSQVGFLSFFELTGSLTQKPSAIVILHVILDCQNNILLEAPGVTIDFVS